MIGFTPTAIPGKNGEIDFEALWTEQVDPRHSRKANRLHMILSILRRMTKRQDHD